MRPAIPQIHRFRIGKGSFKENLGRQKKKKMFTTFFNIYVHYSKTQLSMFFQGFGEYEYMYININNEYVNIT